MSGKNIPSIEIALKESFSDPQRYKKFESWLSEALLKASVKWAPKTTKMHLAGRIFVWRVVMISEAEIIFRKPDFSILSATVIFDYDGSKNHKN